MSKKFLFLNLMFVSILLLSIYLFFYGNDLLLSFAISSGVKEKEAIRSNSPDGRVDAVLIERNAGAMSSLNYLLYIVPKEEKITKKDQIIFDAEHVEELNISWASDRNLLIQYKKADIYKFRNNVYPFQNSPNYLVNIHEVQKE